MDWNWKIRGLSIPVDFSDADVSERLDSANAQLQVDMKAVPEGAAHTKIRARCAAYRRFFIQLLGEETAGQLFAERANSLENCGSIYADLLRFLERKKEELEKQNKEQAELFRKYAPRSEK